MSTAPRSIHLRWWMWVLLAILIVLAVVIAVRAAGYARLDSTRGAIRDLGLPVTAGEAVAGAPPVDEDRQLRLGRFALHAPPWGEGLRNLPFSRLDGHEPAGKARETLDAALRDGAAMAADLGAVLDSGPVLVSVLGYCPRDPALLERVTLDQANALAMPSLAAVRAYANWWALSACRDADPLPHLHRLDQWRAALAHPASMIDAMIAVAVAGIRDDAYLWLASRGRLDAARLDGWIREDRVQRTWCADALGFERCWFWGPLAEAPVASVTAAGLTAGGILSGIMIWPLQGYDCAYGVAMMANAELGLRGRPRIDVPAMPLGLAGTLSAVALPSLDRYIVAAAEAEQSHRMRRLSALIAARHHATGSLPAAADLPPELLAGHGPDLPPLRYEAFPPHRFRIGIDPAGPLPPAIPAASWAEPGYASTSGSPATTTPAAGRIWSVEADLAAIQAPAAP